MLKSYLKIKVRLESWNSSFKCKKIPVFTMARKFAIRLAMKHQFNFWDRNVNININILSIPNVACCFVPNLIIILSHYYLLRSVFLNNMYIEAMISKEHRAQNYLPGSCLLACTISSFQQSHVYVPCWNFDVQSSLEFSRYIACLRSTSTPFLLCQNKRLSSYRFWHSLELIRYML